MIYVSKLKPNEHTIRTYWRDILNDLLKGKNIEIIYDPTLKQKKGQRYPDFYINDKNNSRIFIVETKVGEKFYTDAVVDGVNKMNTIDADAAIAVAFPDSLLNVPILKVRAAMDIATPYVAEIRFNSEKYIINKKRLKSRAKLTDLNDFILDFLIKKPSKEREELDIKDTISVLRDSVLKLYQEIKHLDTQDLKTILGGRTLFENVLGYGDKDLKEKQKNLFHLVAYLLLNQLLFYNIIQKYIPSLSKLTSYTISKLEDIKERFIEVRKKDWEPVFGYDIISLIIATLPKDSELFPLIRYILIDIEELTAHEITNEVLGILFHELIPLQIRKVVAAYYTGNQACELLTWLSIDDYNVKVLDPACGSGSLLTASYRRKRALVEKEKVFTANEHKEFVESDIVGIDIMPFASHLATINLSLQAPIHYSNQIRIGTEDSTKLNPEDEINQTFDALKEIYNKRLITLDKWTGKKKGKLKSEKIEKGPVSLDGKKPKSIRLSKYDLVIMNPPFTSSGNMMKIKFKAIKKTKKGEKEVEITYKDKLFERLSEFHEWLNPSMGLFAYFIFIAHKFLNDSGTIAAVISSAILRLDSTLKVRQFIIDNYCVDYIITRNDKSAFSENTSLREILLILRKKSSKINNIKCKYITLNNLPDKISEIQKLALSIKVEEDNHNYETITYTQEEMYNSITNWYIPISENKELLQTWNIIRKNPLIVDHNSFISEKSMIRGVESPKLGSIKHVSIVDPKGSTGRDIWIFSRIEDGSIITYNQKFKDLDNGTHLEEYKIPSLSTLRAFRTPSGVSTINIEDINDFFLIGEFPSILEFLSTSLSKEKSDIKLEFIPRWVSHCEARLGNLFHTRRVNLSAPGTKLLSFYSSHNKTPSKLLWTLRNLNDDEAKILSLWYNSSIHLLQILLNRIETEGAFIEIGKYVFESLKIINIDKLGKFHRKLLLSVYKAIRNYEFPSLLEQLENHDRGRMIIDCAFLDIMGVTEQSKNNQFAKNLQNALYKEINQLKIIMKGK